MGHIACFFVLHVSGYADRPRDFTRTFLPARSLLIFCDFLLIVCGRGLSFSVNFLICFCYLSVICPISVCSSHVFPKKWSVNELLNANKRFTLNSLGWSTWVGIRKEGAFEIGCSWRQLWRLPKTLFEYSDVGASQTPQISEELGGNAEGARNPWVIKFHGRQGC